MAIVVYGPVRLTVGDRTYFVRLNDVGNGRD